MRHGLLLFSLVYLIFYYYYSQPCSLYYEISDIPIRKYVQVCIWMGQSWPNGLTVGLVTRRLLFRVSGPAGIVCGGSECTALYSTFNTSTEVRPLSKASNPQLLPGRRSIGRPLLWVCVRGVCSLLCVCTWMG